VRDCQRGISSHEFAEWMAYSKLEPFGDEQTLFDTHLAILESILASAYSDPKKGKKYTPDDFRLLNPDNKQDPDEPMTSKEIDRENYQILRETLTGSRSR